MGLFYDDFERANGSLGANWTDAYGTSSISGGYAVASGETWAVCNSVQDSDYQEVVCRVGFITGQTQTAGPLIKAVNNARSGYWCQFIYTGGQWYFALYKRGASSGVQLASISYPTAPPFLTTMRIVWDNGAISATVDGGYELTSDDTTYAINVYMGMHLLSSASPIADFRAFGTVAATLTVSPDVIGNYGECTELELTGTNTSWTAGTPGSPTFTVDHGTITAQTVNSATSATITYCPGDYLGAVIFTDPSTGLTDTAVVTSDPGEVTPPGGECLTLTDEAKALIENAVEGSPDPHFWASHNYIGLSPIDITTTELFVRLAQFLDLGSVPSVTVGEAIENLRKGILGAWQADDAIYVPINEQPIKADTDQTLSFLQAAPNDFTSLADIVALLGGSPTVLSHQDLKTAIDNVQADVDLQPVLDKLDSIQGSELISITDLAGQLQGIRTIAGYSLGDVLAAIGALNPATAPGLAAALATIMGSLGALALEIAAIGAAETEDAAASSAGAASSAAALAWLLANGPLILDSLADLQALLASSGSAVPQPPVWPGLANVNLGDPVDLASTNTLAGPMHGVLLDITQADPGTNRYLYDTVPAWKNIGALSFFTDTGHHETYQALSFAQALYVPKSMAVAGGVRVFHGRGPQGTIRPWSYKT